MKRSVTLTLRLWWAMSLLGATPGFAQDLFSQGQTQEKEMRWSEAFSTYTEVLKRDPTNAMAHYRLGVVSERLGATENALKSYQEALRLNPGLQEAKGALEGYYVNQGVALRLNRQSDEAVRAFRQALSLNPDSAAAHFELGQELEQRQQLDDAITEYQAAVRLDPGRSATHTRLAAAYSSQKQYDRAAQAYQEVLRLNPEDPAAHYGLGVAYNELGRKDQALASLKQAVRFYLLAGQRDQARPAYTLQRQIETEQTGGASSGRKK